MAYNNVEFEILLSGKASILTREEIHGFTRDKSSIGFKLEMSESNSVFLYQDWSNKTKVINDRMRKMFGVNISFFNKILDNLNEKDIHYSPSCVIKKANNDYTIVTIEMIKVGVKSNVIYFVCKNNFEKHGKDLNFVKSEPVVLNLSSLPYELVNVTNYLSSQNIPWNSNEMSTKLFNRSEIEGYNMSYLLKNTCNLSMKGGVAKLEFNRTCSLLGYQQWSINSSTLNNNEDRKSECYDFVDFVNAVNENNRTSATNFTPTTTLYIDNAEIPLIGVITNMEVMLKSATKSGTDEITSQFDKFMTGNSGSGSGSGGNVNTSYKVTLTIDFNTISFNNNSNTLEDLEKKDANVYLNIDDTSRNNVITVADFIAFGNVAPNEILRLPDKNGEYLTDADLLKSRDNLYSENANERIDVPLGSSSVRFRTLNNYGIIEISPYNIEKGLIGGIYSSAPLRNARTSIYIPDLVYFTNKGIISKNMDEHDEINMKSLKLTDVITSYIEVNEKGFFDNQGQIIFDTTANITPKEDFSFITDVYNNLGGNIFINEINNNFNEELGDTMVAPVLSGIKNIVNRTYNVPINANGVGKRSDKTLDSCVFIKKVVSKGMSSQTMGISNCIANNANIIIDEVKTTSDGFFIAALAPDAVSRENKIRPLNPNVIPVDHYWVNYNGTAPMGNVLYMINHKKKTGCQTTYGIRTMGALNVGDTDLNKGYLYGKVQIDGTVDHKMVTPNSGWRYDRYLFEQNERVKLGEVRFNLLLKMFGTEEQEKTYTMPDRFKNDALTTYEKKIINSGGYYMPVQKEVFSSYNKDIIRNVTGNFGNIHINKVLNMTGYDNPISTVVTCGIGSLIQEHDQEIPPSVHIKRVINYGYGGIEGSAAIGIQSVLLNKSAIIIDLVENYSPMNYEEANYTGTVDVPTFPPKAIGIINCVQNGYSCLRPTSNESEEDKDLLYSYLPPYPPQHFNKSGMPEEINKTISIYIPKINTISFMDDYGPSFEDKNVTYKQGHISFGVISNFGSTETSAIGIDRYGGLSYNKDAMTEFSDGVVDITQNLFHFVRENTNSAIAWSFPTSNQITSSESTSLYDSTPIYSYTNNENLYATGWKVDGKDNNKTTSYAPTQMYYAFNPYASGSDITGGKSSDIIFFPMNWGLVTITNVHTGPNLHIPLDGDYNLNLEDIYTDLPSSMQATLSGNKIIPTDTYLKSDVGSAYGIERLLTSLGRIQIMNITSNTIQRNQQLDITEIKLVNTPSKPILSAILESEFELDSGEQVNSEYVDMGKNSYHIDLVNKVDDIDISSDLQVILAMKHNSVEDPTSSINSRVMNRTQGSYNYRFPYTLTNKWSLESDDYDAGVERNVFEDLFTPINEQSKDNGVSSALSQIQSEGASFGVYRTIDYGCNAPGLRLFADYSEPFKISKSPSDFLNGFVGGNILPWAPTKPVGLSLKNGYIFGNKAGEDIGDMHIRAFYPDIRNKSRQEKYYDLNNNVTPYLEGHDKGWADTWVSGKFIRYYLPDPETFLSSIQPFYPLVIADAASPDYAGIRWHWTTGGLSVEKISHALDIYSADPPSDIFENNPDIGIPWVLSYPCDESRAWNAYNGATGTKYEYNGIYWCGNNQVGDKVGNFKGTPWGTGTSETHFEGTIINPTHYWGGIYQFQSYWNAIQNVSNNIDYGTPFNPDNYDENESYTMREGGYNLIDLFGVNTDYMFGNEAGPPKTFAGWGRINSPEYDEILGKDNYTFDYAFYKSFLLDWRTNSIRTNSNKENVKLRDGTIKPYTELIGDVSPDMINAYDLMVSDDNATEGFWVDNKERYRKNLKTRDGLYAFPDHINTINFYNSELWIDPEPLMYNSKMDRYREIKSGVLLRDDLNDYRFNSGIPFTKSEFASELSQPYAKDFENHYYYRNAPAFRGINPEALDKYNFIEYQFLNHNYFNNEPGDPEEDILKSSNYINSPLYSSLDTNAPPNRESNYLWNCIQTNNLTPQKYTWKLGNKQIKESDVAGEFVDNLTEANMLISMWPSYQNLGIIYKTYFGDSIKNFQSDYIGWVGPHGYNGYKPYRKNKNNEFEYPEEFLMYSYSPETPAGFNPQFMQGNLLYLKPGSDIINGFWQDLEGNNRHYENPNADITLAGCGNTEQVYNTILVDGYASNPDQYAIAKWVNKLKIDGIANSIIYTGGSLFVDGTTYSKGDVVEFSEIADHITSNLPEEGNWIQFWVEEFKNTEIANSKKIPYNFALVRIKGTSEEDKNNNIPEWPNNPNIVVLSLENFTLFRESNLQYQSTGEFNLVDKYSKDKLLYGGAIGIETFGSGLTGFTALSSGNNIIKSLNTEMFNEDDKNMDNYIINKSWLHQDSLAKSKYETDNSYYGFVHERRSIHSSNKYDRYYKFLGPHKRLVDVYDHASRLNKEKIINDITNFINSFKSASKKAEEANGQYLINMQNIYYEQSSGGRMQSFWKGFGTPFDTTNEIVTTAAKHQLKSIMRLPKETANIYSKIGNLITNSDDSDNGDNIENNERDYGVDYETTYPTARSNVTTGELVGTNLI